MSERAASGRSRVEVVYAALREGIVQGAYRSGEPLRPAAIAQQLGVSVIPVREAVRLLEGEGLVVVEPNRGARVAEMSADDLEDIYLTRLALEVDALQRSFDRLADEDIERVRHALGRMIEAYDCEDIAAAMTWHREFHDGLYARCGSQRLPQLIDALWSASDRYLWVSPRLSRDDDFGPEHERILAAVESGDLDAAVQALRVHHEAALNRIRETIPSSSM